MPQEFPNLSAIVDEYNKLMEAHSLLTDLVFGFHGVYNQLEPELRIKVDRFFHIDDSE